MCGSSFKSEAAFTTTIIRIILSFLCLHSHDNKTKLISGIFLWRKCNISMQHLQREGRRMQFKMRLVILIEFSANIWSIK